MTNSRPQAELLHAELDTDDDGTITEHEFVAKVPASTNLAGMFLWYSGSSGPDGAAAEDTGHCAPAVGPLSATLTNAHTDEPVKMGDPPGVLGPESHGVVPSRELYDDGDVEQMTKSSPSQEQMTKDELDTPNAAARLRSAVLGWTSDAAEKLLLIEAKQYTVSEITAVAAAVAQHCQEGLISRSQFIAIATSTFEPAPPEFDLESYATYADMPSPPTGLHPFLLLLLLRGLLLPPPPLRAAGRVRRSVPPSLLLCALLVVSAAGCPSQCGSCMHALLSDLASAADTCAPLVCLQTG